jgi:hypothetical protein
MPLTNITRSALLLTALVGCGGDSDYADYGSGSGSSSDDGGAAEEAVADIDADAIPSQDAADAAAEEAIDESNADDAFDDLMSEIDSDG